MTADVRQKGIQSTTARQMCQASMRMKTMAFINSISDCTCLGNVKSSGLCNKAEMVAREKESQECIVKDMNIQESLREGLSLGGTKGSRTAEQNVLYSGTRHDHLEDF